MYKELEMPCGTKEAHNRGERVYLTVDGVIVSSIQNFKEVEE